jgi:hypothetical protein
VDTKGVQTGMGGKVYFVKTEQDIYAYDGNNDGGVG